MSQGVVKPYWIGCLLACFSATSLRAQTVLAGRVVDPTRTPIAALTVELIGPSDSLFHSSTTAGDGTFTLVAPRGGIYRVRIVDRGIPTHVSDSVRVSEGEYVAREFIVDPSQRPWFEDDVDKPVVPAVHSPQPRYPPELNKQGVSGCVLARFVVDTTGRADRSTLRFDAYSDSAFARAVFNALPLMRFVPAERHGRKVRQLVRQPFGFQLSGNDEWDCKPSKSTP
jgi:TonB family protein